MLAMSPAQSNRRLRVGIALLMVIMASIVFAMLVSTVFAAGGDYASGNDLALDSANIYPDGLWSDGTTLWVLERSPAIGDPKIYAYTISTGARDSAKDFNTLDANGNGSPHGIWSDGTTMWVSDGYDDKIYAYNFSNKSPNSSKDFSNALLTGAGNTDVEDIWSDGTTMWAVDTTDDKLYAYDLAGRTRKSSEDFNTLAGAGNTDSRGIWSNGVTMWVVDYADDKLYAYNISDKSRVQHPTGTYPQDFSLNSDNFAPEGIWSDGSIIWVSNSTPTTLPLTSPQLYAYEGFPAVTGVMVRSVGPETLQIIASLANIDSSTPIYFGYRVASPPGSWNYVTVTASANDTTATYKITSGLVAGTEYDFKVSQYNFSATAAAATTTHTHVGTSLIIFDTRDNELYEFSDLSDLTTHTDHGDLTSVGTVRTMEEHEGWLYLVNATNHDLYRSRTPRTVSSWTRLGTWTGLSGGSQSVISANGNLYEITATSIGRVVNPSDPTAGFTDITILGFSTTGAVYYDGVLYLISGTQIRVIPDIDNPTVGVSTTLTGMTHGRGMTVFNGRVLMNEEDDRRIFELQNLDTAPTALILGTYTSDLFYGSSIASWLGLPAPIVSSVSIGSIADTSVTANITATDPTTAGVDFLFRYRIGITGPWTDATSVNSTSTTASIDITGLTATQAYNYQASLDSAFPPDDRTEGTFTTIATSIQLGKVSGVVLTAPVDNGLKVTWSPVTTATSYRVQWATSSGGQSSSNEDVVYSGVTYDIPGLATNTEYFVRVRAETTAATYTSGPYSDEASKLTSIPAPTNVTTSVTTTTITVNWDAVTGATAYEVWYLQSGGAGGGTKFDITGSPPATTYTIMGLTINTVYSVWTAAKIGNNEGRFSTPVNATPAAPPTPQAPTGLVLVVGSESITASWTAPATSGAAISDYDVEYRAGTSGNWTEWSHSGTVLTTVITGLTNGQSYEVQVRAKNSAGDGPWSDIATGTPAGLPDTPAKPILVASNQRLTVTWAAPLGNGAAVTGYGVEYREGTEGDWEVHDHTGTAVTSIITGLKNGVAYQVQVRASNSQGPGRWSEAALGTPFGAITAPQNITLTPLHQAVLLTWDPPADSGGSPVASYRIWYYTSNIVNNTQVVLPATARSHTVTGLTNGTAYKFFIQARNTGGAVETSATQSATPVSGIAGAPTSLVLTPGVGELEVTWVKPTNNGGATIGGYSVQYRAGTSGNWMNWTHIGTTLTATITGLTHGTEYEVRVAATNSTGVGGYVMGTGTTTSKLVAPTNITTIPGSDNISVNWDDVLDATGYVIQWSTTSGNYSASQGSTNQASVTPSSYQITGLAESTPYYIRIMATA